MRRCGREVLHEPHDDCDGRTTNESMVGQLTVRELREALVGEQDNALVIVNGWMTGPVQLPSGRRKGGPVFTLEAWDGPPRRTKTGVVSEPVRLATCVPECRWLETREHAEGCESEGAKR